MSNARLPYIAFASLPLFVAWIANAAPPTASGTPTAAAPVMSATKPPASAASGAAKAPTAAPKPATSAAPATTAAAPVSPAKTVAAPATPPAKPVPVTAAFSPGSGMVILERGGKVLGIGTILNDDGRVLTALSTLVDARPLDLRYADGSRATARVGHADRSRDLALLVPQSGWHKQGLKASKSTAPPGALRAFTGGATGASPGARVTLKGPAEFRGMDGKPLKDAIELATPLDPGSAGTPLIDDSGEVMALVTRACRPTTSPACVQTAVALPVSAVREFLKATPANATLPVPHIGVRGIAEDTGSVRGVRVTIVAPGSPAQAAGIRAGKDRATSDVVVAIDGVPIITPDALKNTIGEHSVGDVVDVLLFSNGRFRHVTLVVAPATK